MPAYGFKRGFVAKILAGTKPHTIRAHRKDGRVPRVGEPFIGYTGMRTPRCSWLFSSTTTKVEPIYIGPYEHGQAPLISIGTSTDDPSAKRILASDEAEALIRADGFDTIEAFNAHFGDAHLVYFTGYLIHWNPEDAKNESHGGAIWNSESERFEKFGVEVLPARPAP